MNRDIIKLDNIKYNAIDKKDRLTTLNDRLKWLIEYRRSLLSQNIETQRKYFKTPDLTLKKVFNEIWLTRFIEIKKLAKRIELLKTAIYYIEG